MYLRETDPVPLDVLWPGHILGQGMTYWAGMEGIGKGMVLADVHTRLALGWPMPPYAPDDPEAPDGHAPCQSVIIEMEDDTSEVWRRVAAAAGEANKPEALRRVFDMSRVQRRSDGGGASTDRFDLPNDLPLLQQQIIRMNRHDFEPRAKAKTRKARPRPCEGCGAAAGQACYVLGPVRLVSINPVSSAASVSVSFSTQQVRRKLVNPVNDMAEATATGVVVVGHFWRNATPANWRDKLGGSKAWLDAARLVNTVFPHPENPKIGVLSSGKSNYGDADDGQVMFRIAAEGYADPNAHVEYRQPEATTRLTGSTGRLEERIVAELTGAERPVDFRQLAAWLGLDASLVHLAATRAIRAGRLSLESGGLVVAKAISS